MGRLGFGGDGVSRGICGVGRCVFDSLLVGKKEEGGVLSKVVHLKEENWLTLYPAGFPEHQRGHCAVSGWCAKK